MKTRTIIIGVMVFIFSIVISHTLMAEKAVAWIVDGYNDCKVIRFEKGKFNEYDATPDMPLFIGNRVEKKDNIESVKIECLPYVKVQKEESSSLTIILDAPEDKKTIFSKLLDWIGLIKTRYRELGGTSRGAWWDKAVSIENATLLIDQMFYFNDYYKDKTLVFKELNGKEVFIKTFTTDLELSPRTAGLIQGKMYILEIKTGEKLEYRSTIRILDKNDEETINSDLAQIEGEKISIEEKILNKAAYLQYISDLYSLDVDLYWLSYRFLNEVRIKEERLLNFYKILIGKCIAHKSVGITTVDFTLLNSPGYWVTVELTREQETSFVPPDFPFTDYDTIALCFQGNFDGYCVVLHESGSQTLLAFPLDSLGYQVKWGKENRTNEYQFDKKSRIENFIFILNDKPLKEIEKYEKLFLYPMNRKKCSDVNTEQCKLLEDLIERAKGQGKKLDIEIMGSKCFTKIPEKCFKGIKWFRITLEK